mmetsp:Transcript_2712/g.4075  ORF Transcript_2712/g.4075 Transcript_2712/m.4075 type:complete len:270 (+) Transcript_2712:95-904(+)
MALKSVELSDNLAVKAVGEKEFDKQYSDHCQYGKIHFWDERYSKDPEPFEWFYPYTTFKDIINDYVAKEAHIMYAGCGNSFFMEDMVDDGFEDITGVDFSRVVIDGMKIRCKDYPEIKLVTANMQDSNLPEKSFDCIIDKGLLDAILCNLKGEEAVQNYVSEVERLLTPDGLFICISYGEPEDRLKYLEIYDIDSPLFTPWYTDVIGIQKPLENDWEELDPDDPASMYFIYLCRMEKKLAKQKVDRKKQQAKKAKKAKEAKRKGHKNAL